MPIYEFFFILSGIFLNPEYLAFVAGWGSNCQYVSFLGIHTSICTVSVQYCRTLKTAKRDGSVLFQMFSVWYPPC